jgi:hypothetical protein
MLNLSVDLIPVFVGAVLAYIAAFAWYSNSLFGREWRKLNNRKKPAKMSQWDPLIGFIPFVIMAYVLGIFVNYFQAATIVDGIATAFVAWLGFTGAVSFGNVVWSKEPLELWVIDNASNLLSLAIMGAVLAIM